MKMNRTRTYFRVLSMIVTAGIVAGLFSFASSSTFAADMKTEYIAHRGLSAKAPENTLAAFKLAAKKKGFYGVEFDIWEAKSSSKEDPLLLVMHDSNTGRMCGRSANIRKISRATLKKYKIKYGKNVRKYKGQKIPTAEQALDTIYEYSKGAVPVIELKHRLSKKALRYLLKYIGEREAVIISFDFNAVADAVKMSRKMGMKDNISTMFLCDRLSRSEYSSTIRKLKKKGIGAVSVKYTSAGRKMIRKFHKAGLKVCVWTVPNKSTAKRYKKMGVDFITANSAVF